MSFKAIVSSNVDECLFCRVFSSLVPPLQTVTLLSVVFCLGFCFALLLTHAIN